MVKEYVDDKESIEENAASYFNPVLSF